MACSTARFTFRCPTELAAPNQRRLRFVVVVSSMLVPSFTRRNHSVLSYFISAHTRMTGQSQIVHYAVFNWLIISFFKPDRARHHSRAHQTNREPHQARRTLLACIVPGFCCATNPRSKHHRHSSPTIHDHAEMFEFFFFIAQLVEKTTEHVSLPRACWPNCRRTCDRCCHQPG